MKAIRFLTVCLCLCTFTSCGGNGEDIVFSKGKTINSDSGPNVNKNTSGPKEAQTRFEFPKLQGGNSETIVHSTADYGMTYALEWDHQKKATRWVCWEMDASNRDEKYSRNQLWLNGDPWEYDPLVPQKEQQATYSELSKSYWPGAPHTSSNIFQKGHLCASMDRIYDKEANRQTFYMTNVMPMVGNFNGKIWQKLENEVRKWGRSADTLWICKGGTMDDEQHILDRTIGGHIVPKYFFMALLCKKTAKGETKLNAIGFWMEHLNEDRSGDALSKSAKTIDQLEALTGIDFFCNLPDKTEENVEKSYNLSEWNGLK